MAALIIFIGCVGGDDDGRRLGEIIIGTWQRGMNEGDLVIEGNTELHPEDFDLDKFEFHADGSYNGMVRKGSFVTLDFDGETVLEGNYQCDNNTLKMESDRQVIVAQVVSFSDDTIQLRYVNENYHVTILLTIRKLTN
jgi:hypothetical protein